MRECRRHIRPLPASEELPPSPGELRAALIEARRLWRLHQDIVAGQECRDGMLGRERDPVPVESRLAMARREAWLLGLVVAELEARVHRVSLPDGVSLHVRRRLDDAVRRLVSQARRYRERHGHLPHDGPFHRMLWAG